MVYFCWSLGSVFAFCFSVCIFGLVHVFFVDMPPKKKPVEARSDETGLEGVDADFSVSSPMSVASAASVAPSLVLSTEQLSVLGKLAPLVTPAAPPPKLNSIPVPKWTEDESPWDFFSKYEQAQKHNKIARVDWGPLLQVYLSGRAQQAYAQVDPEKLDDFDLVKETMLRSLGDTPEEADRRWWTLRRQEGESSGAF